jgi:hypothetical protein
LENLTADENSPFRHSHHDCENGENVENGEVTRKAKIAEIANFYFTTFALFRHDGENGETVEDSEETFAIFRFLPCRKSKNFLTSAE